MGAAMVAQDARRADDYGDENYRTEDDNHESSK
jgi:hypothetical protein